jgi:ATP-dependent Clp protease ATP-binding subunit ClpA
VIQQHIKQPLADEVLFGTLKKGGTVKVRLNAAGDGLDLEPIADGPVKPKPEPLPRKKRASRPRRAKAAQPGPKKPPPKGANGDGGKRGLVPKVPLKAE